MAEGRSHTFQAIEGADRGQDMRGVRALAATGAEQASVAAGGEKGLKEQVLGVAVDQTRAELAEDRGVKAGILKRERQQVLPINVAADGGGGLFIG